MAAQALQDSSSVSIFPNIDVTNDLSDDQTEPSLSVNPIDPLAIAIGEVDDRNYDVLWYCATTNGGANWHNDSLPAGYLGGGTQQFENATDPGVVFDQSGTLYFSNVFYQGASEPNEEACYKLTNDGLSWQAPVYVGGDTTGTFSEADRDYITVDRDTSSPFFGRVYIAWVTIAYPKSIIVESHSSDHGASWSLPVTVSTAPVSQDTVLFQGPIPSCGPNGELYIAFEDRDSLSKRILVASSVDGGVSFAPQVEVSPYRELGNVVPDNFNGHPAIKGNVETNSFPSIAVDRSNLHHGRIYVTWCGRDADTDHVFLSYSDDIGMTWTAPTSIEEDTSSVKTDKFLPWIAVDQSSGDVGVTFYDSRNDPTVNTLVDDYLTLSTDGGQTFTARRISNVSSDPHVSRDVISVDQSNLVFWSDYISLDAMDSVWYPAWTDSRSDSDQDVYMSVVEPFAPMPVTNLVAQDTMVNGKSETILNWQYIPETTFGYPLPSGYQFLIRRGGQQLALQGSDSLSFVDSSVQHGAEYEVSVVSVKYQSIVDSVLDAKSGVAILAEKNSSIEFSTEPAIAGREDAMFVTCSEACTVTLTFYDELGREVGAAISDGIVSAHHELQFMPEAVGVKFFVLKESSSSGATEIVGKISVIEP